jgi:FdrA protein
MMLEGLRARQADPETRVIVVVSKLPAPSGMEKILAQVKQSEKPTVLALMTNDQLQMTKSQVAIPNSHFAIDLREAAALAVALSRGQSVNAARKKLVLEDRARAIKARALRRKLNARQKYARGLYSGGTLCEETMRIWQASLGAVWSNAPLDPRFKLPDSNRSQRHTVIDLGEEEFTIGRPHPMIDNSVRVKRILHEARDPSLAALALDVVIGYGAHPDPATELGAAIAEAQQIARKRGRELIVVASVTGTENDPQGLSRQTNALKKSGAIVLNSNAAVARFVSAIVQ